MNVHIEIERIVLDGLPLAPGDEARFRAALEFELARRVIVDGLATPSNAAVASLPAQPMSFAPNTSATQLGRSVAAAIHQSFGGTQR